MLLEGGNYWSNHYDNACSLSWVAEISRVHIHICPFLTKSKDLGKSFFHFKSPYPICLPFNWGNLFCVWTDCVLENCQFMKKINCNIIVSKSRDMQTVSFSFSLSLAWLKVDSEVISADQNMVWRVDLSRWSVISG